MFLFYFLKVSIECTCTGKVVGTFRLHARVGTLILLEKVFSFEVISSSLSPLLPVELWTMLNLEFGCVFTRLNIGVGLFPFVIIGPLST